MRNFVKYYFILLPVLFVVFTFGLAMFPSQKTTEPPQPTPSELYSEYVKQKLTEEVGSFIVSNYPKSKITPDSLVNACLKHNYNIVFALAQGIQESSLGSAGLARRTNSVWNVGAWDSWTVDQIKKNGFAYPTQDHSIEPYILLVKRRYLGEDKTHENLLVRYVIKGTNTRYASDPNYEQQLKNLYNKIDRSTNINELQELYTLIQKYPIKTPRFY